MPNKTESKVQQEIVIWFNNNYCLKKSNPKMCIFSVPNEGSNAREQMYKKMLGMKSGVSDLIVVMPNKTLYIECKDDKGKQSPNQIEFQTTVEALGHKYYLVRTLEQFQEIIKLEL